MDLHVCPNYSLTFDKSDTLPTSIFINNVGNLGVFLGCTFCLKSVFFYVLGLARTGLIFTRSQDGTQPGQTKQGIRYHVPSCWVWRGGGQGGPTPGGRLVVAQEHMEHRAPRVALCISHFVWYILFVSIIVVTVCFICCSVKLPLPWPTSFCLFLSILLHSPVGEGMIERPCGALSPATGQNYNILLS